MEAQLWLCEYTLGVMEAGERGVGGWEVGGCVWVGRGVDDFD